MPQFLLRTAVWTLVPVSSEYEIQYSDISGSWSVCLVANMDYCVDVSAEGFDDMNMSIELLDDPIDSDSSMTAQLVDVGGQISYIDETQFSLISDSLLVELIPTDEYVRDSMQPVKTIIVVRGMVTGLHQSSPVTGYLEYPLRNMDWSQCHCRCRSN